VIPVIALLAPAAIATFLCSLVSPWLAMVPGAVTAAMLHVVTWTIHRLSGLEIADVRIPGPVWWVAVVASLGWGVCCWAVRRSQGGALATVVMLPLIALLVLWPERAVTTPQELEITAIDVGQGDSVLAVNPDGRAMLIDAGGPVGGGEVAPSYDIGEQVVSPYLWSRRFRRVDVMVLSHAHSDHMGGMAAVLANFRPRELWVGIDPASRAYGALLAEAAHMGVTVRHLHAGDRVRWTLRCWLRQRRIRTWMRLGMTTLWCWSCSMARLRRCWKGTRRCRVRRRCWGLGWCIR
jgi:competence protein ComEC